jgi:hypothetical protein
VDKKRKDKKIHPKVRNAFALHAMQRKAGFMKDRRAEKGGTRNKQRDHLETDN